MKISLYPKLESLGPHFRFRVWPMRAPDIITLTNKSLENKFKLESESKGLGVPFLDHIGILGIVFDFIRHCGRSEISMQFGLSWNIYYNYYFAFTGTVSVLNTIFKISRFSGHFHCHTFIMKLWIQLKSFCVFVTF